MLQPVSLLRDAARAARMGQPEPNSFVRRFPVPVS